MAYLFSNLLSFKKKQKRFRHLVNNPENWGKEDLNFAQSKQKFFDDFKVGTYVSELNMFDFYGSAMNNKLNIQASFHNHIGPPILNCYDIYSFIVLLR